MIKGTSPLGIEHHVSCFIEIQATCIEFLDHLHVDEVSGEFMPSIILEHSQYLETILKLVME